VGVSAVAVAAGSAKTALPATRTSHSFRRKTHLSSVTSDAANTRPVRDLDTFPTSRRRETALDTMPPPRKTQFARPFPSSTAQRIETRKCAPADSPDPTPRARFADALKESTPLARDAKKSVSEAAAHDTADDARSSSGARSDAKAPEPAARHANADVSETEIERQRWTRSPPPSAELRHREKRDAEIARTDDAPDSDRAPPPDGEQQPSNKQPRKAVVSRTACQRV
jgi:hypothetical protein